MEKSCNFVSFPELYFNDAGYFIFKFKNDEEINQVMEQGPYFIYGKPLFLKYWTMDFELNADLLHVLPLWITLPNFILHLWVEKSISKITNVVGRPITTDDCTARKLQISYARVLVEVDIKKPVRDSITINHNGKDWNQKIEYEWMPKYCQTCLKIGHNCSTKKGIGQQKSQQMVWKPTKKVIDKGAREKKLDRIVEEPGIENDLKNKDTPDETWTVISSNRTDKAKKKTIFTPVHEMMVQNVFTSLGIGVNLEEGSGRGK